MRMSVSRMELGGAGEDDAAFIEDVGAFYYVQHAFDVVFHDHDRGLEPLADLGDSLKNLFGNVATAPCARHVSVRGSRLLDEA